MNSAAEELATSSCPSCQRFAQRPKQQHRASTPSQRTTSCWREFVSSVCLRFRGIPRVAEIGFGINHSLEVVVRCTDIRYMYGK
ncbi:unnamed protein product [Hermetia illucens]|uniref:Uncharacterized protein n=1 Tax=Hermetia illucens TaxID=343691 RepID=A0A7R8UI39_HERIL|nr:unnamed protein product [Hermetia illucens]